MVLILLVGGIGMAVDLQWVTKHQSRRWRHYRANWRRHSRGLMSLRRYCRLVELLGCFKIRRNWLFGIRARKKVKYTSDYLPRQPSKLFTASDITTQALDATRGLESHRLLKAIHNYVMHRSTVVSIADSVAW